MNTEKLSPMMVQYLETKKKYPGCLLFYRLGDFYELFFEDAKIASAELDLVLTARDCGLEERASMCGVPFHAADNYITRLVKKGYSVAIGEQMEDPKFAKGLVKRSVIKVITPGTICSSGALSEDKNNYLMCAAACGTSYGISVVDVSTGDYLVTELDSISAIYDEINRFMPSELICNAALGESELDLKLIEERWNVHVSKVPELYFDPEGARQLIEEHFHANAAGLGIADMDAGLIAAGAVLKYVYDTQFSTVDYISDIKIYSSSEYMIIDTATMRNLELLETMRDKEKRGTLLWVLDKTKTAMGSRLMRRIISQPLLSKEKIELRQQAIGELNERFIDREEISEYLRPVYDLERLLAKFSSLHANPTDANAFRQSISMLPHIKNILDSFESELLKDIDTDLDTLPELGTMLERAIEDEPPISVRDGDIIKNGYNEEIDRLRLYKTDGRRLLLELEEEERNKTGIKGLRIKYNKIFGYCIEVSNSFKKLVPDYFIRKQTLSNSERYTTERLEELSTDISGADDKLKDLEYAVFTDICRTLAAEAARIQRTAKAIAYLDVLCSLSNVAMRNRYVCPKINEAGRIEISEGRHPVVELMLKDGSFVANDLKLNNQNDRIAVITGPNMAGKSTYMRQAALITLMAQIGSYVPAKSADIAICDRIFTRVGASDDLASGQSTFMVEMTEVANILRNATSKSLLILDEIGRGTSTYDGLSIAWAVVEYISDKKKLGAKALFATHYHELTELEGKLKGVNNYCISVKESDGDLIFLRKIIPGGADKSYGIAVARLAGVPREVTERAEEIAAQLAGSDIAKKTVFKEAAAGSRSTEAAAAADTDATVADNAAVLSGSDESENTTHISAVEGGISYTGDKDMHGMPRHAAGLNPRHEEVVQELISLDLTKTTPMEAFFTLNELQTKLKAQ